MTLRVTTGNLLTDESEAVVNTVNTVGVMGKGVALQFRRAYPDMFEDYKAHVATGEFKVGSIHIWENPSPVGPRYIINFPTKRHWRGKSKLEYIESGLRALVPALRSRGVRTIAMPPLGCGAGGLDWNAVLPLVRQAFEEVEDIAATIYAPAGAPAPEEMIERRSRPELTLERAAACAMLDFYSTNSTEQPSLVAIQKLAYLLQELGGRLRLSYVRGAYGPYADGLRHALSSMEGHFIYGFGDGSRKALDEAPLFTREAVSHEARTVISSSREMTGALHRLYETVDGFESTYGLELLATVHWAINHGGIESNSLAVRRYIEEWSERKSKLFPEGHIEVAINRLEKCGLVAHR